MRHEPAGMQDFLHSVALVPDHDWTKSKGNIQASWFEEPKNSVQGTFGKARNF